MLAATRPPILSRDHRERSRLIYKASVTYLITFACYGCHVRGDELGSVDHGLNLFGNRLIESHPKLACAERRRMDQPAFSMDKSRREVVLAALIERCSQRHWRLLAAHV